MNQCNKKSNQPDIYQASVEDITGLAQLISLSHADVARRFSLTPENCPKHPSNCRSSWITTDMERGIRYFILTFKDRPIGCMAVEQASPDMCYMERLSVLPEYRNNGFGKTLVDHAIYISRTLFAHKLGIGIIAEFTRLKNWYETIGFYPLKKLDLDHLPFTVLLMEYKIYDNE